MVKNRLTWKIGGPAGAGIMVTGFEFSRMCARGGLHILDYAEYPSIIRGGHNTYQVSVDEKEIFSQLRQVDLLVALDKQTIEKNLKEVVSSGGLIYDSEAAGLKDINLGKEDLKICPVPLAKLAREAGGKDLMRNSVAVGATIALLNYDFENYRQVMMEVFKKKGEEVVNVNINTGRAGYDYIKNNFKDDFPFRLEKVSSPPRMVITGNEAIAMGAIRAGCKFYCAYPMTPVSAILHFMAAQERKFNLVVKHTEDEISAINMAIGASFAGVRAMVATSGGGFSLMVEALGMAAITETPIVIIEGQRPGPSTGMPTWTDQGDLRFVMHASQGDFLRVIIAPGDVEEAFYRTIDAFNLAEKYQIPVIIICDKYLCEGHKTVEIFDTKDVKIDRGEYVYGEAAKDIRRYEITNSGVSPRVVPLPGGKIYCANSDEHDETGLVSEESDVRIKMMDKRERKVSLLLNDIPEPILYGPEKADITIIGWGSTKNTILEAMKYLEKDGIKANFLHLVFIHPLRTEKLVQVINSARRKIVIENNQSGQLAGVIREKTGISMDNRILKYDGRPFYPEEICERVKEVLALARA